MNRVIITGASGYVGFNLCRELSQCGVEVFAIVRPGGRSAEKFSGLQNLHIVHCDLDDIKNLPERIGGPDHGFDAFYHFAWQGVYGSDAVDYHAQIGNIDATGRAVEAALALGCKKFIFPDSIMEYDCMRSVSQNGARPGLRNIYYSTKMASHIIAKTLCAQSGMAYIEAVITNIYGPGNANPGFITDTLRKLLTNQDTAFSACEQLYDFIYVTDAVKELALIGEFGQAFHSYYVGTTPRKLKDYILEMQRCTGYSKPLGIGKIQSAVIDIDLSGIDPDKLYCETGYRPQVSFETGIAKTIEWMRGEFLKEEHIG